MSGTEKTTSGSLRDSTKFTNLDKSDGVLPSLDLRLAAIEEKYIETKNKTSNTKTWF